MAYKISKPGSAKDGCFMFFCPSYVVVYGLFLPLACLQVDAANYFWFHFPSILQINLYRRFGYRKVFKNPLCLFSQFNVYRFLFDWCIF